MLGLVSWGDFREALKKVAREIDKEIDGVKNRILASEQHLSKKMGKLYDEVDKLSRTVTKLEKEITNIKRTKVNISALDTALEKRLGTPLQKAAAKIAKDAKTRAQSSKKKKKKAVKK